MLQKLGIRPKEGGKIQAQGSFCTLEQMVQSTAWLTAGQRG